MRLLLGAAAVAGVAYFLLSNKKDGTLIKLPKGYFKTVDGETHLDVEATIMSIFGEHGIDLSPKPKTD